MNQKEICQLWIEYIKESDFKEKHGEAAFQAYVDRIETISKTRQLTPRPTVRKLSDIIEEIIDRVYSEAKSDGDISFEHLKKRLMFDIKLTEQTNLLLYIHCGGIPPRGGQKTVLAEIGKQINAKIKDNQEVRKFYQKWTEPNEKVVPELALYLKLYQAQKHKKIGIKGLERIASDFAEKIRIERFKEECKVEYNNESQIRRMVSYAKRILKNVENGFFPGDYKSLK